MSGAIPALHIGPDELRRKEIISMLATLPNHANDSDAQELDPEAREVSNRREFLSGLGKWSTAAIAAIVLSDSEESGKSSHWLNSRNSWSKTGGG